MNLTARILIGMGSGLLLGLVIQLLGVDAEHWIRSVLIGGFVDAGGQIFIRSLQLLVVPLVLVSLVCGASSLGHAGNMGRVAGKALGLYLLTTAIAISIALLLALVIQPGVGVTAAELESTFTSKDPQPIKDTLINIFPGRDVSGSQ
jgi:Na+/H+-dicarboxylate symporter